MPDTSIITQFQAQLQDALSNGQFVKLSLGNYKGSDQELKNIYVRLVEIKRAHKLSFTIRYKTRDIVKNYDLKEGIELIGKHIVGGFMQTTLFTTENDLSIMKSSLGDYKLKVMPASLATKLLPVGHNKEKKRLLTASPQKRYLQALKITDANGEVFKNAQEKFKQINQYVELLSPMLKSWPSQDPLQVVDMGSGKGYLTFALYDYLKQELKINATVTGVEFRPDLVELCNSIANDSGFHNLHFAEGTIQDFHTPQIDLLIALHACDTATDDAIYKGIKASASLIVVAPCCHKQIRREMTAAKTNNELQFLLKHGIFLERQAEMVTDGIRALIMEYFGYKTKIMEFHSDVHTPKNLLVVGAKQKENTQRKAEILQEIREIKAYFGIRHHHLEALLGLNL